MGNTLKLPKVHVVTSTSSKRIRIPIPYLTLTVYFNMLFSFLRPRTRRPLIHPNCLDDSKQRIRFHQSLFTIIFRHAQAKEDLSHFNFLWGDDLRPSASTYTNNATIKDYHETLAKLPSEGRKAPFKKITAPTFITMDLVSLQVNFWGIMGLSHTLCSCITSKDLKAFPLNMNSFLPFQMDHHEAKIHTLERLLLTRGDGELDSQTFFPTLCNAIII